ncbi:MAG: SH3 domain-containing protein, partial [Bacteroidota bacterium]
APGIFLVIVLGLLFYTLNFGRDYNKAIVVKNNTYLMSGPSAGAEVLEIIKKGHRVNVKDATDVWVQIEWDDQEAYVKADKIRNIEFL